MARVIVRPKARREISSILAYYIETAGIDVARRFRKAPRIRVHPWPMTPFLARRELRSGEIHLQS